MDEQLLEYRLKGYCCSQIIMDICLKKMGKENADMVDASASFCFGLGIGANCGIIIAALAIICLENPKEAAEGKCEEFIDWFSATFSSIECNELLEGNPLNKVEKCPIMVEASIKKIYDILEWE